MQDALRSQLDLRRDGMATDVEELAAAIQGSAREVSYSPEQSVYEVLPFFLPGVIHTQLTEHVSLRCSNVAA